MASAEKSESEVISVELPAPEGWRKKFTPKQGGTPKRNEIVFISPTGEEIKTRRQLDQYLRSHPGGPPSSEFDWGTGDTPRRSARISEIVKASEAEKPMWDSNLSSQKGTKRKKNTEDDEYKIEGHGSGLQKGTKIKKKTEVDGHKAGGEASIAEGDGPKDVDMKETDDKSKEETSSEGLHCLVGQESAEKTKAEENVEQTVESQDVIKHVFADKALENDDEEVKQDVDQSKGKGTEIEPGNEAKEIQNDTEISPPAFDSKRVVSIEKNDEVSDSKKHEAEVCKKDAEILSENGREKNEVVNIAPKDDLKPVKEVKETPNDLEVSPAECDSKNITSIENNDGNSAAEKSEASVYLKVAEILPESGGKDDQVNAALKDNLEPGKEVKEKLNDTEVSPPTIDPEKISLSGKDDEVSAAEKDEASALTKGTEILSENGGKKNEVNAAPEDNSLHNYDDGKMQLDSFLAKS